MRRAVSILIFAAAATLAGAACAQKLTLARPVLLHAGPDEHYAAIAWAPAGESIKILRDHPAWTRIAIDGARFFVATPELAFMSSTAAEGSPCDYGYPYSGSNHYFASSLTELRHGEPLGALFGYHLRYPCH